MQLKWILCLALALHFQTIFGQTVSKPPYLDVMLSSKRSIGPFKEKNPMLIDSSQAFLYFDLLTTTPFNAPNDTVWIELIKKNKQSEKTAPLWSKQCIIEEGMMASADSIDIAKFMPETDNYVLNYYFIIRGEKVFARNWGLQVVRPKTEFVSSDHK